MENLPNVSSEEELLELRNHRKISNVEYEQLRDAMLAPKKGEVDKRAPAGEGANSKRKQGKIAFNLMLAGFIVPIISFLVCFAISCGGEGDVIFSVCLFLWLLIEIPAFVLGVIAWPDVFGKATVVCLCSIVVLVVVFGLLSVA